MPSRRADGGVQRLPRPRAEHHPILAADALVGEEQRTEESHARPQPGLQAMRPGAAENRRSTVVL